MTRPWFFYFLLWVYYEKSGRMLKPLVPRFRPDLFVCLKNIDENRSPWSWNRYWLSLISFTLLSQVCPIISCLAMAPVRLAISMCNVWCHFIIIQNVFCVLDFPIYMQKCIEYFVGIPTLMSLHKQNLFHFLWVDLDLMTLIPMIEW